MVLSLHQLCSLCDSGVAIGDVDKCQNVGYHGARDS